jgi:hypothetical protein
MALALTAILMAAVTFRTTALSTYGLSDDEVTKFHAAEAYARGDFGVNAEHPMLMKLAVWGSLGVADRWNAVVSSRYEIPVETAIRLPNALLGAGSVLLGWAVALVAALLVALDPTVTSINRLAKEDTFVVFFFLLAVWLYERAKQVGTGDVDAAQTWYVGSAAAFGAMLASKYLPHLYGLYALFNVAALRDAGRNSPNKRRFFLAMGAVFVMANFAIVFPSTWQQMLGYVRGGTLSHHGWPYAGHLWVTDVPISPLGIPPTFYAMLLLTRMPLITLGGALAGAVVAVVRRRERGFVFLRVFLFFQLIGYSVMAAKFLRYSLPILVVVDLTAAVGIVTTLNWLGRKVRSEARAVLLPLAYGTLAMLLFAGQAEASPFFSMYRTPLGRWMDRDGERFPECGYDYGVRNAVGRITGVAPPGAEILTDVPQVVRFYLGRSGRTDLRVRSLSGTGLFENTTERWVLVQNAHLYFETEQLIALLRMRHAPVTEYRIKDVRVLQVYRIPKGSL